MNRHRALPVVCSIVIAVIVALPLNFLAYPAPETLSPRLTDQEFWRLVSDFSEPNGFFRSDNLLSNELGFQYVIPDLLKTAKAGRVYLGVGPEQNFTYITALKPKMVFIFDVRRGNLDLQLMYKALFELSKDRTEFISKLFSRVQPEGLTPTSNIQRIFAEFRNAEKSDSYYAENLQAIKDQLTVKHHFALSDDDLGGIEYVYRNFYQYGPRINYNSSTSNGYGGGFGRTSYAELMAAEDGHGMGRSFLATEENFGFMKELETKNLLVPVVGNFAGPKAIRAVATYLKQKQATVSAFYLSNVEQYLEMDGIWNNFCQNVATLPLDETSTFIRSVRDGQNGFGRGLSSELGSMTSDVKACATVAH